MNLLLKVYMHVKIIQKTHLQQKLSKQTTCGYLILYSIHLMAKNKINVTTKKKKIPWKVLLRLKTACNKNNCRWKKEMLPPTEEEYES